MQKEIQSFFTTALFSAVFMLLGHVATLTITAPLGALLGLFCILLAYLLYCTYTMKEEKYTYKCKKTHEVCQAIFFAFIWGLCPSILYTSYFSFVTDLAAMPSTGKDVLFFALNSMYMSALVVAAVYLFYVALSFIIKKIVASKKVEAS